MASQAFLAALPGASLGAVRRGLLSTGIEDNAFSFFPELMDSTSLFLTANCDTIYFWGFIDLSDGPMVIDVPRIDAAVGNPRHDRRHVVPVGHRRRFARTRPWGGRPLSDRRTRL